MTINNVCQVDEYKIVSVKTDSNRQVGDYEIRKRSGKLELTALSEPQVGTDMIVIRATAYGGASAEASL